MILCVRMTLCVRTLCTDAPHPPAIARRSQTFRDIVLQKIASGERRSADALIFFYMPGCGQCHRLSPHFDQLVPFFKNAVAAGTLLLAKVNGVENDIVCHVALWLHLSLCERLTTTAHMTYLFYEHAGLSWIAGNRIVSDAGISSCVTY